MQFKACASAKTAESPRTVWVRGLSFFLLSCVSASGGGQAVNELPHPQPPVALGLLKVKPLPWNVDT